MAFAGSICNGVCYRVCARGWVRVRVQVQAQVQVVVLGSGRGAIQSVTRAVRCGVCSTSRPLAMIALEVGAFLVCGAPG